MSSDIHSPASCSYDLFIKLWKVDEDYKNFATLRGHEHSISSVRFMPGDDRLVSASRDQSIRIWEVATSYVRQSYSHTPRTII
jgi:platelet-activating factor acetylhydrolase IB subunit alpha